MKYSTCGYLYRDGKFLMLYRNAKKDDVNHGKWIGVGGKTESGETPRECMIREIREETGYEAESLQYRGILYFRYPHKECEKIWIYTADRFSGTEKICDEGRLEWIPSAEILSLPLWEGDIPFLRKLIGDDPNIFCLDLTYDEHDNLLECREREAEQE